MSIETYNKDTDNLVSYPKKEVYTAKVEQFVSLLHEFLPVLKQEFEDLEEKSKVKPCKPFKDKMASLSAIYNAEKDLYYWYIETKRQA